MSSNSKMVVDILGLQNSPYYGGTHVPYACAGVWCIYWHTTHYYGTDWDMACVCTLRLLMQPAGLPTRKETAYYDLSVGWPPLAHQPPPEETPYIERYWRAVLFTRALPAEAHHRLPCSRLVRLNKEVPHVCAERLRPFPLCYCT